MAVVMEIDESVLAAKFDVVLPHLDERQRRLLLAAEARSLGHGGISLVARASGFSRVTITGGVGELEAGVDPMPGRARRAGAGRKRLTETDPGLAEALDALVEPDTRGDPMSRLRWTTKSTRNLAEELRGRAPGVASQRGAAAGARVGLQPAGQRQDHGRQASTPTATPSSATSTTRSPPSGHRITGDQRGCQEEGVDRRVRKQRPRLAPGRGSAPGQRPRLPRPAAARPSPTGSTTWAPTPAG